MRTDHGYRYLPLADLADHLGKARDDDARWTLIAEFLAEFRHEAAGERMPLLAEEPAVTGDKRWDVLAAALAEHLAARDGHGAPAWAFNTPAARVDAVVHAPAAFRRRGVFIAPQELDVA